MCHGHKSPDSKFVVIDGIIQDKFLRSWSQSTLGLSKRTFYFLVLLPGIYRELEEDLISCLQLEVLSHTGVINFYSSRKSFKSVQHFAT